MVPATRSSLGKTPDAAVMRNVLGPRFNSLRYAIVSTGSGVLLELIESEEPATERSPAPAEFWRTGPWFVAVVCPDIEDLVARIEQTGGQALSAVNVMVPGAPFKICMCTDPFGVALEVYSHPMKEFLAAVAG